MLGQKPKEINPSTLSLSKKVLNGLNSEEKFKWDMRNKFIQNNEILSKSKTGRDMGLIFKNLNESPNQKVRGKKFK